MIALAAAWIVYNMPWSGALERRQFDGPQVSLVRFEEHPSPVTCEVPVSNVPPKGDWDCSMAKVNILQRVGSSSTSEKRTVLFWRKPTDVPVDRSSRYLMISVPAKNGVFRVTNGSDLFLTDVSLVPRKPADEAVLLLFPTPAKQLPKGLSGPDLVTAAILNCCDPADESSYRAVVRLLCRAHPDWIEKASQPRPWGLPPGPARVCPDGPLVALLRAQLKRAATQYEKSKVLELMTRWHVKGSTNRYFDALRPLLGDPMAYSDEDDQQLHWGLIRDVGEQAIEFDGFFQELEDDALRDLLGASNPILALYWMDHCGQIPQAEQMARFAILLNWNDNRIQYRVAEHLANWLHEPTHSPKLYGVLVDREIPYPDLREQVAYWKRRFGIDK